MSSHNRRSPGDGMDSKSRKSRRNFLKAAAGVTAGAVWAPKPSWAESGQGAPADSVFPKIDRQHMITPDQAWDWNMFKAKGGPTYAGSPGWKRYTDFLIARMPEFGVVDLDYVEIPYDHYIVEDWPDRGTHIHDSGVAIERLVVDGTAVPVVASYGMTSGFTPPEGITAPMLYYDPAHPPAPAEVAGKILVFQTAPYPNPPYSNSFLDNYTLTDYEWRSPGKWAPLFVPPPTSVTTSYHSRWVWNQLNQFAAIGISGKAAGIVVVTTCRPARRSVWRSAASIPLTRRPGLAPNTSTARR